MEGMGYNRQTPSAFHNYNVEPANNSEGKEKEMMPTYKRLVNSSGKEMEKIVPRAKVDEEKEFSTDLPPSNIAVKRKQMSSWIKLVEVTTTQGKDIVTSMQKLSEMEDQKMVNQGIIPTKALDYFKFYDAEVAANQRGMVCAFEGFQR